MIKKLNYVWLGGAIPASVESCLRSWKKNCLEWEIVQWDETNFDINKFRWVREAIAQNKYAFAADFIRLYILYNYGGVYIDTDVEIRKDISPSIVDSFVTGIEDTHAGTSYMNDVSEDGIKRSTGDMCSGFCIQAGFMYAERKHPFIARCMESLYDNGNRPFLNPDGSHNGFVIDQKMFELLREDGIKYIDKSQSLRNNIFIHDSSVYATRKTKNRDSFVIHWYDQSWKDNDHILMILKKLIKRYFFFLYRLQ